MPPPWQWHIDIDRYIDPYLPRPPQSFSRNSLLRPFGLQDCPQQPLGNVGSGIWAFIGAVAALCLIYVIDLHVFGYENAGVPLTIGSFGAAAVLQFYAIESPFSQPRNAVLGQVISSVIGVAINKGFASLPGTQYNDLRWLAGALACSCATTAMGITGTVHPPAGATALLAVASPDVADIGWSLVPMVILNCIVMLVVALVINNIQRHYPKYWWTPAEVGTFWARKRPESDEEADLRDGTCGDEKRGGGSSGSDSSVAVNHSVSYAGDCRLVLTRDGISVPPSLALSEDERECLEGLCRRLCYGREIEGDHGHNVISQAV